MSDIHFHFLFSEHYHNFAMMTNFKNDENVTQYFYQQVSKYLTTIQV